MKEYLKITNEDNMELMARYPDNYFDLAIVDPPYGIGQHKAAGKRKNSWQKYVNDVKSWDNNPPKQEYFKELFRVSKNQIIWGANYFVSMLPISSNWIVWNKMQPQGLSFAMHELAYCSIKMQARIFTKSIEKNRATTKESARQYERIHPTQKPRALYQWLLTNYAEPNFKILDTHLGSGSIAIAVDSVNKIEKMNLTLTACELDTEYYQTATQRIKEQTTWNSLF